MLDKQSSKLLINLARICEDGSFKIVETTEITKAVSHNAEIETVRPMLKFLQDNEMIDIKYSDEHKYSLAVLPKGRVFAETQSNKKIIGATGKFGRRTLIILLVGTFAAAFVGAILGVVVAKAMGL
jgi:hypothetical protein